jgi:hypothetical protein
MPAAQSPQTRPQSWPKGSSPLPSLLRPLSPSASSPWPQLPAYPCGIHTPARLPHVRLHLRVKGGLCVRHICRCPGIDNVSRLRTVLVGGAPVSPPHPSSVPQFLYARANADGATSGLHPRIQSAASTPWTWVQNWADGTPWLAPPSRPPLSTWVVSYTNPQAPSALLHSSDVLPGLVYANQAVPCGGSVLPVGLLPFRAVCELERVGWQEKPDRLLKAGPKLEQWPARGQSTPPTSRVVRADATHVASTAMGWSCEPHSISCP